MEQKNKDCQSCKKQKLNGQEIGMITLGLITFGLAIYGAIHLVKHLFN